MVQAVVSAPEFTEASYTAPSIVVVTTTVWEVSEVVVELELELLEVELDLELGVEAPLVVCPLSPLGLIHTVDSSLTVYTHGTPSMVVVTLPVGYVSEVVVKLELELVPVVEGPVLVCPLSPVRINHDVWPLTIEPVYGSPSMVVMIAPDWADVASDRVYIELRDCHEAKAFGSIVSVL
jgi:hypothetical protein